STTTNICVYRANPFDGHLNKLSSRKAKGREITINYLKTDDDRSNCHILFIPNAHADEIQLIEQSDQSILTVGENQSFLTDGGLISLVVANNNVQFQINLTKAKQLGFEISGNLLEIAKIVT
ncbi:MAG: YfiR family protein, partial [Oceanicoccus sp.]|uniref:YfiR family protein n=1 Tax=Oceanicoccus sp. TaxID=2691044 RepID=UPI002617DBAB